MCSKTYFILLFLFYEINRNCANPATKFKRLKSSSAVEAEGLEERLHNLEMFALQLSPILENKLDENNRKLEEINFRMSKIESVISQNLEKVSETLQERNLRLEISESNWNRKISAFNQKLDHFDRKIEDNLSKLHISVQNVNIKLEGTEKVLTRITDDLQSEISDAIYAIDELKGTQSTIEENILHSIKNCNKSDDKFLAMLNKTVQNIAEKDNKKVLLEMKKEIKSDLNDYANKVADMTFDMWENQKSIIKLVKSIEETVNNKLATGVDKTVASEESIFALDDQDDKFAEISDNFQKVLSNQQIFLDNCHRLQMDERQIEDEISEILKKLIHLIDQRHEGENKELKNLEKAIKTHDNHIYRNLNQANTNILNLFEKISKSDENIIREIKNIQPANSKLISTEENSSKVMNDKILRKINQTEDKLMGKIDNQTQIIGNSLQDIKNATNQIAGDLNRNFKEIFGLELKRDGGKRNSTIDDLILDVFGTPPAKIDNSTNIDWSKLIDVRSGQDKDEEKDNLSSTSTENPTSFNIL